MANMTEILFGIVDCTDLVSCKNASALGLLCFATLAEKSIASCEKAEKIIYTGTVPGDVLGSLKDLHLKRHGSYEWESLEK